MSTTRVNGDGDDEELQKKDQYIEKTNKTRRKRGLLGYVPYNFHSRDYLSRNAGRYLGNMKEKGKKAAAAAKNAAVVATGAATGLTSKVADTINKYRFRPGFSSSAFENVGDTVSNFAGSAADALSNLSLPSFGGRKTRKKRKKKYKKTKKRKKRRRTRRKKKKRRTKKK